jgi:aminoglycoside phosphotransferase (APT) family kinase protein
MVSDVEIDVALVRALLESQRPQWADLPLVEEATTGTDNKIFRLGESMVVRLPKVEWAADQPAREHQWLPLLAGRLPLEIPKPLALGAPGCGFVRQWSVHLWIEGASATRDSLASDDAADRLAKFISAIHSVDLADGPECGAANGHRGVPLALRDAQVRKALVQLGGESGIHLASAVWEDARAAAPWTGTPTWLHGDLQPANLLVNDGQLTAVIDFGMFGVGDPACDLMAAWTCFRGSTRERFLTIAGAGADAVRRGRGWAVSTALVALATYAETNDSMAQQSRATINEACEDFA